MGLEPLPRKMEVLISISVTAVFAGLLCQAFLASSAVGLCVSVVKSGVKVTSVLLSGECSWVAFCKRGPSNCNKWLICTEVLWSSRCSLNSRSSVTWVSQVQAGPWVQFGDSLLSGEPDVCH